MLCPGFEQSPMAHICRDTRSPSLSVTPPPFSRHSTTVYPTLISRVAEAFRVYIVSTDIAKDGLTYKDP